MTTSSTLLLVTALVASVLLLRLLVRAIGASCGECGRRLQPFTGLAPEDQRAIVAFFQRRERRRPDVSAVFVCDGCRRVYDDFSGEKRSMEGDDVSICKVCGEPWVRYVGHPYRGQEIARFVRAHPDLVADVECLRCRRQDRFCPLCDTPHKVTGCRHCQALYEWQADADSGLRFLVLLDDDRPVLTEARDRTGLV